jgi:hypothetical protein
VYKRVQLDLHIPLKDINTNATLFCFAVEPRVQKLQGRQPSARISRGLSKLSNDEKAALTDFAAGLNNNIQNLIPENSKEWTPPDSEFGRQKMNPTIFVPKPRTGIVTETCGDPYFVQVSFKML